MLNQSPIPQKVQNPNESAVSEGMRSPGDQLCGQNQGRSNKYCGLTGLEISICLLPANTELKKTNS